MVHTRHRRRNHPFWEINKRGQEPSFSNASIQFRQPYGSVYSTSEVNDLWRPAPPQPSFCSKLKRVLLLIVYVGLAGTLIALLAQSYGASFFKLTKTLVREELPKLFVVDQKMTDYALESSGSRIIDSSQSYFQQNEYLGISYNYASAPNQVIKPSIRIGECWAMKGSQGYITILLAFPVVVEAITIEHIPLALSSTGNLASAPKEFFVMGRQAQTHSRDILLGRYRYDTHQEPMQQFEIKDPVCLMGTGLGKSQICSRNKYPFKMIKVQIVSNYGHHDYTCLYKIGVHSDIGFMNF